MKTALFKIFTAVVLVLSVSLIIGATVNLVNECKAYNEQEKMIQISRNKKPPVILDDDDNPDGIDNCSLDEETKTKSN